LRDYISFGISWIILSVLGEIGAHAWGKHFYFYVASAQGAEGQRAAAFILMTATPVFIFVVLMLIFFMIRFRRGKDDLASSKVQVKNNKAFISIWFGISLVVNLFLFIHPTASAAQATFQEELKAQSATGNNAPLIIDVTARQWEWFFSYPEYGITQSVDANGNDILVLPVNRPVEFVLRSYEPNHTYNPQADVIHSFWIPSFGLKTDVIPGLTRYEFVTPTKITSTTANPMSRVQCAEVCGPGHPWMEADMKVLSATDFATWVQQEKKLQ
jgi:cytochrome c oxidase subunit 2